MKYTEGSTKMNNNLISEATDLLKKYARTGDRRYFLDAAEKISLSIANAINPINPMTEPLVAAMLTRYADFVKENFDSEAADIYSEILNMLKNTSATVVVGETPAPTKGE